MLTKTLILIYSALCLINAAWAAPFDEGAARTVLEAAAKQSGMDKKVEIIVKDSLTKEQLDQSSKLGYIYALFVQKKVEYKWSW